MIQSRSIRILVGILAATLYQSSFGAPKACKGNWAVLEASSKSLAFDSKHPMGFTGSGGKVARVSKRLHAIHDQLLKWQTGADRKNPFTLALEDKAVAKEWKRLSGKGLTLGLWHQGVDDAGGVTQPIGVAFDRQGNVLRFSVANLSVDANQAFVSSLAIASFLDRANLSDRMQSVIERHGELLRKQALRDPQVRAQLDQIGRGRRIEERAKLQYNWIRDEAQAFFARRYALLQTLRFYRANRDAHPTLRRAAWDALADTKSEEQQKRLLIGILDDQYGIPTTFSELLWDEPVEP